jgi:hypothetical protein
MHVDAAASSNVFARSVALESPGGIAVPGIAALKRRTSALGI